MRHVSVQAVEWKADLGVDSGVHALDVRVGGCQAGRVCFQCYANAGERAVLAFQYEPVDIIVCGFLEAAAAIGSWLCPIGCPGIV